MKLSLTFLVLGAVIKMGAAEPLMEQRTALAESFGKATVTATRLVKSERSKVEPFVWLVFAEDTHRKEELVKLRLDRQPGREGWRVSSVGAGKLLQRVPPMRLDWAKVKVGPAEARLTAEQGAKLAKATFDQVEFQLATQPTTSVPEWGLTLFDATGAEVGFVVVSAETGAVIHQDFGPIVPAVTAGQPGRQTQEVDSGEEAARAVKRGARKAWDWTEKAGRETGGFFRELFR
jgi:hypothetical protein